MSNDAKRHEALLGTEDEGKLFIVSAPAGTGKTTLVNKLTKEFPGVVRSVSFTTRKPRQTERDGVDYCFVTREDFEKKIEEGTFLEYVELYGNYYGTCMLWVKNRLRRGEHVVLVIDTQGALRLKEYVKACSIFVMPPSLEELKRRLVSRKSESEESLSRRLAIAQEEIEKSLAYDYRIINDNLEVAYDVLRSIFIAEAHQNRHHEE